MARIKIGNIKGPTGSAGVGIKSIVYKNNDSSGGNVYTITLTNNNTYEFTAPKGAKGDKGEKGEPGESTAVSLKWNDILEKPSSFPSAWSNVTGKPSSFPPSAHNQSWTTITEKPDIFPTNWSNVSGKPATFPPDSHTHPYLSTSGGTVSGNLTVTGTIVCNGDITAFSDKELKTNIKPLNSKYAIDKFMNIDFYSFNYKDNIDKLHYGVIAQELQKIYPEMVIETEKEINGKKALAVNYQELFIQVCSIVQEQERRIKELENKLKGDTK